MSRDEERSHGQTRAIEGDLPRVIDGLMSAEVLLPAQLPLPSRWSAEKRLAAAVLASALNELQLYRGRAAHRRQLEDTMQWVHSEEVEWPFSFLRLCALFDLDPQWVRAVVDGWMGAATERRRMIYRHAA